MRPLVRHLTAALGIGILLVGCAPEAPVEDDAAPAPVVAEPASGQEDATPYLGLTEEAALDLAVERNALVRVGTADDVGQPGQTEDYEVGRITLVVVDGVVAEAIIETDTGPVTVAAG